MPPRPPANLVIRPEKLGDLVAATPVFRAFKESFPDQPLHLLVDEGCGTVVERDPFVDRIIRIPWRGRHRGERPSWRSIVHTLRREGHYQRAAILYANLDGWNWASMLAGARQIAQLGGTVSAKLLGHSCVLRRGHTDGLSISELFLSVAGALGATAPGGLPRLYLGEEEREAVRVRFPFLREPGNFFVHAFSVSTAPNLSPGAYFSLCRHLAGSGRRIYLIGTRAELEKAALPSDPAISTELVGALNLRELMAACSHADLVIGGSSGIVHLASALGVPTLALYCPHANHHLVWGPRGPWSKTLTVPAGLCRRLGAVDGPCQAPARCDLAFGFSHQQIMAAAEELMAARTAAMNLEK